MLVWCVILWYVMFIFRCRWSNGRWVRRKKWSCADVNTRWRSQRWCYADVIACSRWESHWWHRTHAIISSRWSWPVATNCCWPTGCLKLQWSLAIWTVENWSSQVWNLRRYLSVPLYLALPSLVLRSLHRSSSQLWWYTHYFPPQQTHWHSLALTHPFLPLLLIYHRLTAKLSNICSCAVPSVEVDRKGELACVTCQTSHTAPVGGFLANHFLFNLIELYGVQQDDKKLCNYCQFEQSESQAVCR